MANNIVRLGVNPEVQIVVDRLETYRCEGAHDLHYCYNMPQLAVY